VKVKEGGRDSFEIAGVGEEREDLFSGAGEEEGPFEMVGHLASCVSFRSDLMLLGGGWFVGGGLA